MSDWTNLPEELLLMIVVQLFSVVELLRFCSICYDGKIRYWNGKIWSRIKDQMGQFSDIVVHRGLAYALDVKGIVWLISQSLRIFKYGPSLDENIIPSGCYRDKSFVECCGELYIVDRLFEENPLKRTIDTLDANVAYFPRFSHAMHDDVENVIWYASEIEISETNCPKTVSFKVYKMDKELGKWVEVKSSGDNVVTNARR